MEIKPNYVWLESWCNASWFYCFSYGDVSAKSAVEMSGANPRFEVVHPGTNLMCLTVATGPTLFFGLFCICIINRA